MKANSPLRYGRRLVWLPAAALVAAVLTGCSSSKSDSTAAPAATGPAATAATTAPATGPATGTPSAAASTPATPSATAATPAPVNTSAIAAPAPAPTGKRPADACTLLNSPQIVQALGTSGPFTGTHPDKAADGSQPWGCTWGSHESYASVHDVPPTTLARIKADPGLSVTPLPGMGQEAVMVTKKPAGGQPVVYVLVNGYLYAVEAVKSRGPGDEANASAELVAETLLAGVLATRLGA
ncbi:hypothetical protein [Kitasatospora sp. NPDC097643]|uniref:hypothetical protein n=1 Tax=Kitasatospora sp. NPDC097643 TaxID=3157230 RepID=UPI003328E53F